MSIGLTSQQITSFEEIMHLPSVFVDLLSHFSSPRHGAFGGNLTLRLDAMFSSASIVDTPIRSSETNTLAIQRITD